MHVSILDQTPLKVKGTPELAFNETIELARFADQLGYTRYWVAEHHSTDAMGGSSPEVLLGYIAAITSHMRIGSGGVMLQNYSPYKVAENFKVLSALAPNRVDLGVGRSPGGLPNSTKALQDLQLRDPDTFTEQLRQLQEYLGRTLPASHPLRGLMTTPRTQYIPDLWLLGTSPSSARLAASMGLRYAFAYFSPGQEEQLYSAFREYRRSFVPHEGLNDPYGLAAIRVIAADTDEEAEELAKTSIQFTYYLKKGRVLRMDTPEAWNETELSLHDKELVDSIKQAHIIGSKETIQRKITELKERYLFDELMALSFIYDLDKRRKSFRILHEAVQAL
ncbi:MULTISPECIES: LLM class flavin-dependent oxidoreductase [unclassified Paenibacillus]|uniref:LLM class flavin-dependent oxidoreductase n=1 Tax=Paenibacillus provencensis TaxID=441151 RepID=A0ABW3PUJ6_9BACL|nr:MULTISPECIES: LLM class flavin-dependent oxidoreductase [unclassified Paenibacillus]MCM3129589.1 LLM class flavin-dependent oxidoreductase [Paenibacillus sp. MER 78]SFS53660.1 luciferase family oxidoreductase, group 1 [Paenibacillus sp. 453mf]